MVKKIPSIMVATSLLLTSNALARENGAFAGVSLGRSQLTLNHTASGITLSASNTAGDVWLNDSTKRETNGDIMLGAIVGYRYFVAPKVAIRGYGEYEYAFAKMKDGAGDNRNANYMQAIVGADAMLYFNKSANIALGAFAGGGLAYARYDSKLLLNKDQNAFGAAMNAGLHADFAYRHGIDIGVKFLTNKVNVRNNMVYENIGVNVVNRNGKIRHKPEIFLRYTFHF